MRSSFPFMLLIAVVVTGCIDLDPEPQNLFAGVGEQLLIPLESEGDYVDDASAEWVVVDAPEGSRRRITRLSPLLGRLDADMRGRFVVDRWMRVGASDRWTHRYYVDVDNAAPIAIIGGNPEGRVGVPMTLAGLGSIDSESNELRYSWRLAFRPRDSVATLENDTSVTVSVVPDIAGLYTLKLGVFDGELWSAEEASLVLIIQE